MKRGVFVLLGIILASVLVVGSIDVDFLGNSAIVTSYEAGDNVQGVINLSIEDEDSDIELSAEFDGGESLRITLLDWLNLHTGIDFTCVPGDCNNDYTSSVGENSKLISAGTSVIGSKFGGNLTSDGVTDYKFDVTVSGSGASCSNQVQIDILDDGIIEWENDVADTSNCGSSKKSICYGNGEFENYVNLVTVPYCEKIILLKAPGYSVSAFLKKDSSGSGATYQTDLLKASLYDSEGDFLGSCNLPEPSASGGYVNCNILERTFCLCWIKRGFE